MTSFTSLLSSIGGGQPKAPQPKTTSASNSTPGTPGSTRLPTQPSGARPAPNNMAAGVKRKPSDLSAPAQVKTVRTEVKVPVRPVSQSSSNPPTAKPGAASSTAYRGTARPSGSISTSTSTPQAKPAPKPAPAAARPSPAAATTSSTTAATGASQPKRGFAAIMAKAKAAEEAAKAAGTSTIRHKTVEKTSKRERERAQAQQAAAGGNLKPCAAAKGGKAAVLADRSRSGTPNASGKKAPEVGYTGTMKKPTTPAKPQISYTGTMRTAALPAQAKASAKGQPQDRYGGYASWSDLSAAEDEDDGYDSEGSSMMEAGLDDVEAEESLALQAARREDQEALEEEARLKREKNERKKKLMALNKSAAARKKF